MFFPCLGARRTLWKGTWKQKTAGFTCLFSVCRRGPTREEVFRAILFQCIPCKNQWLHARGPFRERLPQQHSSMPSKQNPCFQGRGQTTWKLSAGDFLATLPLKNWFLVTRMLAWENERDGTKRCTTPCARGCAHNSLINNSFYNI